MKPISRFIATMRLLLFCILLAGCAAAQDSVQKADTYFQQKQYKEALSIWHEMVAKGNTTAGLYYNIGLAESLLNNTPGAILSFEQALRLKPGNALILKAINAERKKIENVTIPVEPFFIEVWYKRLLALMRPGYWSFLGLSLLFAGLGRFLLTMKRMPAKSIVKRQLPIILASAGIIAILLGILRYREIYRDNEAIVTIGCEIRQAPSPDSPIKRTVAPGEKVTITDQIGGWYNVNLLNLDAGWIEKEKLATIMIGKE